AGVLGSMITFHVPVTMGAKMEGSPLHKNVPPVSVPWYVCAGAADEGLAEVMRTSATRMNMPAVAMRRCGKRRFRLNQQFVFIQITKGTGSQSSGIFVELLKRHLISCPQRRVSGRLGFLSL